MVQAEFIRKYNEKNRRDFEPDLFKRSNEELVESIRQIALSLQQDKYFTLQLLDFETIWDYEEIYNTLRQHEESRRKKKDKNTNSFDFINIRDTDMILCKLKWLVRHNGHEKQEVDGKTIEVVNPSQILEVLVALPRFVNGYYFRLAGNYYSTTFQIVDGSTYNNCNASQAKTDTVTMKSMFGPIKTFRILKEMDEFNSGSRIKVIEYSSIIFNTSCIAMYYLLANFGIYGCMDFLQIPCIKIANEPNKESSRDDYVCFEKKNEKQSFYIYTPKYCFEDAMCQSLIATIYDAIGKETEIDDLYDQRFWLKTLGISFKNATVEKGLFVLDSTDGLYDNITKKDLHLSEEDKNNIFFIMRWLLREFSALRSKENVDIRTKRVRIADCLGAVWATKVNIGMHRITDSGRKITLKKVIQAVYTNPMYILNTISTMSNVFAYRDLVNDNDASTALKYTYKGISGLGEDGGSVQPIYRYVDPTHVGILDLDASSNSDPGMSGMICPFAKIYNHSFSDYKEPDTWRSDYQHLYEKYMYERRLGKESPFLFKNNADYEAKIPYITFRKKIEDEELELHRLTYPFVKSNDPNLPWFPEGYFIDKTEQKAETKSLFTIIDEDSDDEDFSENNENEDYNNAYNFFIGNNGFQEDY